MQKELSGHAGQGRDLLEAYLGFRELRDTVQIQEARFSVCPPLKALEKSSPSVRKPGVVQASCTNVEGL